MDLQLNGRTALITGGSKGIGFATASCLANEGCHLHLAARTEADLEKAAESIRKHSSVNVQVHPTDLSDGDAARALIAQCSDIDILVNNAGAIPVAISSLLTSNSGVRPGTLKFLAMQIPVVQPMNT